MSLEVIGVGQGRTGTASLKVALEHLEIGRCYHMGEAVDNPICYFWHQLADYYPKAKIVLTMRDVDSGLTQLKQQSTLQAL